jgi:hypothetical protein
MMIPTRFSFSWMAGSLIGWGLMIPLLDKYARGVWFDAAEPISR